MKKKLYINYTAEELLADSFFQKSMENADSQTIIFWNQLVNESSTFAKEFELAKTTYLSLSSTQQAMDEIELSELKERILHNTILKTATKKKKYTMRYRWSVAASICVISFSVAFFYLSKNRGEELTRKPITIEEFASQYKPQTEVAEITISREEKKDIIIEEKDPIIEYTEDGYIKVNTEDSEKSEQRELNQLIVPQGKRSTLTLSDGTKLWVNAGTQVVYPTSMKKGEREIYVDGEIYIDVTPDEKRPFVIKTKDMDVTVLGTSFVVNAYEQETEKSLVLVSGHVKVKTIHGETLNLLANDRLLLTEKEAKVTIVNTEYYTSWKDGYYLYKDEKLGVILDRLALYYGKQIKYDSGAHKLLCSGRLDLRNDFISILDGMQRVLPLKYKQEDQFIIITTNQ